MTVNREYDYDGVELNLHSLFDPHPYSTGSAFVDTEPFWEEESTMPPTHLAYPPEFRH